MFVANKFEPREGICRRKRRGNCDRYVEKNIGDRIEHRGAQCRGRPNPLIIEPGKITFDEIAPRQGGNET